MLFSTSTLLAVAAAPFLVAAQGQDSNGSNPFNIPKESLNTEAGDSVDLTWKPTTSGTVTIYLRSGASNNLDKGQAIASNIDNSGSFTWQVPDDIVRGSNYALEIVDDDNDENTNYTPPFVIESDNNAAPSSASGSSSSASATATESSSADSSSTDSSSTDSSSTATETDAEATSTETDSASSTGTASSASATSSGTASSSMTTSTSSRSSSTASSTSSASADDAQDVQSSEGGASRTTVTFAGLLGLVAAGAIAL